MKKHDRQCTCGDPGCPALAAVRRYVKAGGPVAPARPAGRFACPVCGAPACGDLIQHKWRCSANAAHLYAWWTDRLRANREMWLTSLPEEAQAIHAFIRSPEREQWLQAHGVSYTAYE